MASEVNKVLRPVVSAAVRHNKHLWWELKREIWEDGYQPDYHWAQDYRTVIRRSLGRLSEEDQVKLVNAWQQDHSQQSIPDRADVLDYFVGHALETLVERAMTAAYRTVNW